MQTEDATELAARDMLRADPELAEALAGQEVPEDETEEVEHDGRFYRIPRPLKGAFLMNADYTRKTQELADHRRSLDGERRAFARQASQIQAVAEDRARLAALDEQIAELEGLDWEAYAHQDLEGAQAL